MNNNETGELNTIHKSKFSFVKKQDLPEKPKTQEAISDTNLEAKIALENFSSEHSPYFFRNALELWLEESEEMRNMRNGLIQKMRNWEEYKKFSLKYKNLLESTKTANGIIRSWLQALINLEWWNFKEGEINFWTYFDEIAESLKRDDSDKATEIWEKIFSIEKEILDKK